MTSTEEGRLIFAVVIASGSSRASLPRRSRLPESRAALETGRPGLYPLLIRFAYDRHEAPGSTQGCRLQGRVRDLPQRVLQAPLNDVPLHATEPRRSPRFMLRQCCAPACNCAQLSSKRRNDNQVDSKFFAGLSHNPLSSLALLRPVSIFES